YAEWLEMAEVADRSGLTAVWVAEHHFQPGGLCPSPPVLLSAAAARTRRVRLGAMVSVLPFHSPVVLAEQYAMLDQLSAGRVNLGVGSGYIGFELDAFGVAPENKRERFDTGYDSLTRALRGESVSVIPGSTPAVRLNVLPLQQPHPPIWIAVQRREAIPFVARRGANLALVPYATLDSLEGLRDQIRLYRDALPAGIEGQVSVAYHVYLGERVDESRAALQRYLDSRRATQSTFYLQQVAKDPRHASVAHLESTGLAALGDAESVGERLQALGAAGVDEVLAIVDFGGLPLSGTLGSVQGLGRAASALAGPGP
ncbi:MAG: LLM class flavin-dependent oxidoreductase, partial [Thermoplasmata archaeon]|nr:LLM class flavin-dependent oxidoreductase [Thermoplasmata archaeon]